MVLLLLGVKNLPTQDQLWDAHGAIPYSVEGLAGVLNEILTGNGVGYWKGGTTDFEVPAGDEAAFLAGLGSDLPWIAHVRQGPGRIGHLVVVVEVTQASLHLLDPWPPGTSYDMTLTDFLKIWSIQAAYFVRARA